MKYIILFSLVFSLGACSSAHKVERKTAGDGTTGTCHDYSSEDAEEIEKRALEVAKSSDYQEVIAGKIRNHKKKKKKTRKAIRKAIKKWFAKELNLKTLLRDQIAYDILNHEDNGRNSGFLTQSYTIDRLYCYRKVFSKKDIKVKKLEELDDGRYKYEAKIELENGFRGGTSTDELIFNAGVEITKSDDAKQLSVKLTSYPIFETENLGAKCEGDCQ